MPVPAYYSALIKTPSITFPNTPTQTPTTTISSTPFSPPIIIYAPLLPAKSSELSTPAVVGISIGAGLATLGVIAIIVICFWRKRKRGRASPIAGGAGPDLAATYNGSQGYQSAGQSVQQYQPQADNTKFPEPGDIRPYSPAPVYTSGGQHMSHAPVSSYDPNIASKYLSSAITTVLPLSPNPSHQTHQQKNTTTSWDFPPNSPTSSLGPDGSNLHHSDLPPDHSELGAREAGMHQTSTPWSHSALGVGIHHPGSPGNTSELSGAGALGARYPDSS